MINLAQNLGQKFVNSVFSSVHTNYDKANDAMSLFQHRQWKKDFISMLNISKESIILDLASGTGDIVNLLLERAVAKNITGSDINPDMLEIAKKKIKNEAVNFIIADAICLPFENATFDFLTCTFGIRNFQEIEKAIVEARRVLKKGGKFAIMEFLPEADKMHGKIFHKAHKFYIKTVLPKFDKIFKNDSGSYEYLSKSILAFQSREKFAKLLESKGFDVISPTFCNGTIGVFICTAL
jgi:demethylmenaquinone methyltransferase/2-methoxy-6-polyprenyl-1,4-benzoquinol methylase